VLPKSGNPRGRGVHDYGILRAWGVTYSGISQGKERGVKAWKLSVIRYAYFLELPTLPTLFVSR